MKIAISFFLGFVLSLMLTSTSDLFKFYTGPIENKYKKEYCYDKGLGPDTCDFSTWYDPYAKENPIKIKIGNYLQLGEGSLYYLMTKRCTTFPMHNVSALGDKSGTITLREYFNTKCSRLTIDLSDLIWE